MQDHAIEPRDERASEAEKRRRRLEIDRVRVTLETRSTWY